MCVGKISEINNFIGLCEKCGLKQKVEQCKKACAARVVIENTEDRREKCTVSMFNEVICKLTCDEEEEDDLDTETKLLSLDVKQFQVNSHNVVISAQNIV